MQFAIYLACAAIAAIVTPAVAIVPQEHAHEDILRDMRTIMPAGTQSIRKTGALPDVVFGLLGKQAADGAAPGKDGDCLQQDLADTAISNANGDKKKIATALLYRALERNSNGVGVKSALCNKRPINAILQGLTQHQDSASEGATEFNKQVELTLGEKLKSLGEDPVDALRTATFAPGDKTDATAKGNACDDENDTNGCINTLKRAVPIATAAELQSVGTGTPKADGATDEKADEKAGAADEKAGAADEKAGAADEKGGAADGKTAQQLMDDMEQNLKELKSLL